MSNNKISVSNASVSKADVHAAVARAANHLLQARQEGVVDPEVVEKTMGTLPAAERALLAEVFAELSGEAAAPITRERIKAFVAERSQEIKGVSDDWTLTPAEEKSLSVTGQLAVSLARALKDVDVLESTTLAVFDGLGPEAIMAKVRDVSAVHVVLGYRLARLLMFSDLDNWEGLVRGIYTQTKIDTLGTPDVDEQGVNTEHVWPKARGVKKTPAATDLHHLFPADQEANSKRGSHPFGHVVDAVWSKDGSKLGRNEKGDLVYEPPDRHKGNIARALFYIAAVYELPFPPGEREVLAQWNLIDPVDAGEFLRNDAISKLQGNRNVFIDHPALISRVSGLPGASPRRSNDVPSVSPAVRAAAQAGRRGSDASPQGLTANDAQSMTVHLDAGIPVRKQLPAWFPKDFDLKVAAGGVATISKAQRGLTTLSFAHVKSLVFADADHTFLKTDVPILMRNLRDGSLMRHPVTKELLTLPNRHFREALDALKAELPDVKWDQFEYAYGEMGSISRILDTDPIPWTMDKMRAQGDRDDGHQYVITARSVKGAAAGLRTYLEERGVRTEGIFTPNEESHAALLGIDAQTASAHRKALTMAATLQLYRDQGAKVDEVTYYEDADSNLIACMQLLPALFPDVKFSFYDLVHTGHERFRPRLVASTLSPGDLATPAGDLFSEAAIAAYRSADAPLPPPIAR